MKTMEGLDYNKLSKELKNMFEGMFPEFSVNPKWLHDDLSSFLEDDLENQEFESLSELKSALKELYGTIDTYNYAPFVFEFNKKNSNKILDKYGIDLEELNDIVDVMSEDPGDYRLTDVVSIAVLYKNRNKWIPQFANILWNNMEQVE